MHTFHSEKHVTEVCKKIKIPRLLDASLISCAMFHICEQILWFNSNCAVAQTTIRPVAANMTYRLQFWAYQRLDHPFPGR